MSKRLAKNSIAAGLTTLLVTTGLSFAAQGAAGDRFVGNAEAQFISAGDEALGGLLETVADQIEGVEVTCEPSTPEAECTATQASDALLELPVSDALGINLGAANNFATGDSGNGSSTAASGAVTDSGTINTGTPGAFPSDLSINLNDGALGPVAETLADPQISVGAIASTATLTSPDAAPGYDYSIADVTLDLEIPALKTLFDTLETQTGSALTAIDTISLASICAALPAPVNALCATIPADPDPITVTFPSLDSLLAGLADNTDDGIVINLADGTVSVDLVRVLGEEINQANFPADADGTDLLPLVTGQVDTAVANLLAAATSATNGIVPQILNGSSITLALPELIPGTPVPPLVLSLAQLTPVLQPLLTTLSTTVTTVTSGLADATPDLSDALNPLLSLNVGVLGLADNTLVGDDASATAAGDIFSITALRAQILPDADAADLRLATSVVGPNGDAAVADDEDDAAAAAAADDGNDNGNDDGAAATAGDGNNADAISDADSAADADASASLPNAGAPNLLPFFLLGIALLAFGLAVLLNERRRLGLADSGNLA